MSRKISLVIYTILHLLTDGICAHAVVNYLYANNSNSTIIIFFLYNFIALCTQPILGLIVDKFQKKEIIYESLAAISIILVIIGSFLTNNWIISTMMMGFGNGLLYVVGGKETVHRSNNKLLPLSLYVSFGAMGVFLGTNITNIIILHIFRLLSVICVIVLFILPNQFKFKENKEVFCFSYLLCLFAYYNNIRQKRKKEDNKNKQNNTKTIKLINKIIQKITKH